MGAKRERRADREIRSLKAGLDDQAALIMDLVERLSGSTQQPLTAATIQATMDTIRTTDKTVSSRTVSPNPPRSEQGVEPNGNKRRKLESEPQNEQEEASERRKGRKGRSEGMEKDGEEMEDDGKAMREKGKKKKDGTLESGKSSLVVGVDTAPPSEIRKSAESLNPTAGLSSNDRPIGQRGTSGALNLGAGEAAEAQNPQTREEARNLTNLRPSSPPQRERGNPRTSTTDQTPGHPESPAQPQTSNSPASAATPFPAPLRQPPQTNSVDPLSLPSFFREFTKAIVSATSPSSSFTPHTSILEDTADADRPPSIAPRTAFAQWREVIALLTEPPENTRYARRSDVQPDTFNPASAAVASMLEVKPSVSMKDPILQFCSRDHNTTIVHVSGNRHVTLAPSDPPEGVTLASLFKLLIPGTAQNFEPFLVSLLKPFEENVEAMDAQQMSTWVLIRYVAWSRSNAPLDLERVGQ
jgi:hypothetical protein